MKNLCLILGVLNLFLLNNPALAAPESLTQIDIAEPLKPFDAFDPVVLANLETRYLSAKRLPNELTYRINRNFDGEGVIYIGKITKPEDAEISALVTVEKDGSFVSAVAPGRELVFYAHGYSPITLKPEVAVDGPLHDVGELVFQRFEESSQASLTTIAVTRDTKFDQEIEARLIIDHRDFLGRDGGTWQHRYRPTVETQTLKHGERVTFTGLGLNPYRLELWADGYVVQAADVRPKVGEFVDLDALVLTPAKTIRFRYIGNFDLTAEQGWPEFKELELVANGKTQFTFHQTRHPKGYMKSDRMRLEPDVRSVAILYPVIPTEYYDLGEIALDEVDVDTLSAEMLQSKKVERPVYLESGHVYFMQNKRREVNALFEVTLIED